MTKFYIDNIFYTRLGLLTLVLILLFHADVPLSPPSGNSKQIILILLVITVAVCILKGNADVAKQRSPRWCQNPKWSPKVKLI